MENTKILTSAKPQFPRRKIKVLITAGAVASALVGGAAATAFQLGYIPHTDKAYFKAATEVVSSSMLDPESAQFRKLTRHVVVDGPKKGASAICGEFNGKNANGAYSGYSRFIFIEPINKSFSEPIELYSQEEASEAGEICRAAVRRMKNNPYESISGKYECDRAIEMQKNRIQIEEFDFAWSRTCTKAELKVS